MLLEKHLYSKSQNLLAAVYEMSHDLLEGINTILPYF